jgi:hypothetical protein
MLKAVRIETTALCGAERDKFDPAKRRMVSNDGLFFRLQSYFEVPFLGLHQDRVPKRLFSYFP